MGERKEGPAILVIRKSGSRPIRNLQITLRFTISGALCVVDYNVAEFSKNVAIALNAYGGRWNGSAWVGNFLTPLDYVARVDPTDILVEGFQGWGTSLCWWANVVARYPNRDAYANLAFNFLKLNIVRYNIGGGENPQGPGTLEFRARMPGFEPRRGMWTWDADLNQRWMLKAAIARGVNRVEAFANSPPYWMTVSGSVTGAKGGGNNLLVDCEKDYAIYLAEAVSNIGRLDGVTFHSIAPMNEPAGGWWNFGRISEGCHMSVDQQERVINLLRTELDRRGLKLAIDAPEDWDERSGVNTLNSFAQGTRNNVGQISTHTYWANDGVELNTLAGSLGKPLWHTEYGDDDATGMRTARRIRDDLRWLRPLAWCYWQVVDYAGGWGMLYNPLDEKGDFSYTINRKFYAIGQFTRFLRPGCEIVDCGDANSIAGYDPLTGSLAIVTVNDNVADFTVTFDLRGFSAVGDTVQCYRTSASESLKQISPIDVTGRQFISTVPAQSVTTFLLQHVTAEGPREKH